MHLSKLQLLGFKSFADDTTLEFGAGITAVVGPNGSGKSNIVDAILWALGERSHKALRGHAATDVIFNGAATRKPTGLAEVSLFFDNSDGTLPLGFQEVQVTRRLFRDGDNEYRLGGSKCRLRDVLDLFLDTGVGPDAGCIISQGEIDAILSAKPEDRRGLIEGAAGIQKYHARRSETRRRLDKVSVDLTRIGDITSELEKQVEPLKHQAEIARQYDALVARLRALQLAILARDYAARVTRLELNQAAQIESGARVDAARLAIENFERLEQLTSRRLRELEAEVETLSDALTECISQLKSVEGEIAVARERRRALSEQGEYQAREIGGLRARVATTREQIAATSAAIARAQNENSGLNVAAAHAEAKLGQANAQLSEAARELQIAQNAVIEKMRAGQKRRENIATARAEIAGLETRLAELGRLETDGAAEAHALDSARALATKSLQELRAQIADQRAADAARAALESARQSAKVAAETLRDARETRAKSASRAGALRELEENLEGFAGGTRAVLSAAQKGELPANYTPVADAIRAPRELELAIEIALGAAVNNLICPDNAAAKTAIEWLKRRSAGRATFLPLDALRASGLGQRTLDVLHDKAVRGLASELVECAPEFGKAVDYLLGRILIVETLEDGTRLARRCDNGARLVTLDGELVLPAGAITGGAGKGRGSGLLKRKRELDEFEAQLTDLQSQVEGANAALTESQSEVAARENEVRLASENHNELRRQLARQEREVEGIERELRRCAGQREVLESGLRAAREQLETKRAARENAESAAARDDADSSELESRVEGARAVVGARQSEKDAIAAEVADVRAQFGAAQERLSAMRREIAELGRAISDAENQIKIKQAQIDRATSEDAQIVGAQSALVARLEELTQRNADLEYAARGARAQRGEALEKLEEVGGDLKSARTDLHGAEDELHKIEVKIASTQAEISDMERRLREEFSLESVSVLECLESGASLRFVQPPAPEVEDEDAPDVLAQDEATAPTSDPHALKTPAEELEDLLAEPDAVEAKTPVFALDYFLRDETFERRKALAEIEELARKVSGLGAVNTGAVAQYEAVKERLDFLTEQRADLEIARDELNAIMLEIDGRMKSQFLETFTAIRAAFSDLFARVFGGGQTHLALTDPENLLETGIELRVQLPGKAAQDISLLSGGERALTALSFMMAILRVRPAPFVILDEVDAPLDQSNVGRFTDLLREFTDSTQFIVITHNNGTMQAADVLYGVTQQEPGHLDADERAFGRDRRNARSRRFGRRLSGFLVIYGESCQRSNAVGRAACGALGLTLCCCAADQIEGAASGAPYGLADVKSSPLNQRLR